jgi:hypothetical protein
MATTIVTTHHNGTKGGKGKGKKFAKRLTKKHHRTKHGYSMKSILKGQMTYKRKGRKR